MDSPITFDRRYVCFPPAGGTLGTLREVATTGVAVWGVEYPGRDERIVVPPPDTLEELAEQITRELADLFGPQWIVRTILVGFSMGAFVALELAQRVHARVGAAPGALVVVGAVAPQRRLPGTRPWSDADALARALHRDDLAPPTDCPESAEVREYGLELLRGDLRLASAYRGPAGAPAPCPVAALCGDDDPVLANVDDATGAWRSWATGRFTFEVVRGGHLRLLAPGRGPEFWAWVHRIETALLAPEVRRRLTCPLWMVWPAGCRPSAGVSCSSAAPRRLRRAPAWSPTTSPWTFRDLDLWSNRFAHALHEAGAAPGRIVASVMTRSVRGVLSPLAIAKTGAAYLPVDPALPSARIGAILADARPAVVVTDIAGLHVPADIVLSTEDWTTEDGQYDERPLPKTAGEAPAYVVYTSGSTGRPKGVVVGHRSLVNLYRELAARVFPPGRARQRVAHGLPLTFDASWDPLLWMVGGHELHLVPDIVRADPELYVRFVRHHRLTVVEAVPAHLSALLDAGLLAGDARPCCS